MIQALAALLGAALTVAACYAAGALLLDGLGVNLRRSERFPLAFLLGAACLHLGVFVVLALRIAYWPVLAILAGGVVVVAAWRGALGLKGEPEEPLGRGLKQLSFVLFGAFSLLYFFHALAPESSPDGSAYHLGLVARYLRAHGFERITTNMYAALSAGVEMLYVPAFAMGRYSTGALVHFAFAIVLALAMLAYGRRLGKPWVGAAGALLTFASPVAGIDGSSAYNDVAVAAIVFGVFYWLQIWDEQRNDSILIAVGLLAGYAYAAKYTAFVMLPFALGFVLWKARKIRPLITISGLAFLMFAPWMLKDWIVFENPVAPFANRFFRNPYFHIQAEEEYTAYYRRYDLPDLRKLPLEVTVRGGVTEGVIGMAFLAAPVALASLRFRAGRRLLAAGAVVLATYFLNVGTRFLIPSLPFFSLAMALALGNSTALLTGLMIFHAVTSWPSGLKLYADANVWRLDRILFREALRIVPQDQYLREHFAGYDQAKMIDSYVPKGEAVLAFLGVPDAYTAHEILVSYQAASNETTADILNVGWVEGYQPRLLDTFRFPEQTLPHLRVTVVAASTQQWSVHELRFFDRGVELPRRPEWRLRAWPNPWEVQMAFDNSPATRWRSGEHATPGMYLDVDFGKTVAVDEVRLETSYDSRNVQVQVEGLPQTPVVSAIEPPPSIRQAATYEMARRGIHYLLIHDSDPIADDIRDDPDGWGLTEIASGYGVRLYQCCKP
jgi:hypothetical protein